jgi:ADP-ribose pyrophosphatase YjhB (NUDIX family)
VPDRQLCAGGIVFDGAGRLLLVRRGRAPWLGAWTIPGGRCRPGESAREACVRELREETGLDVRVTRHAGRVERPATAGSVYVIDDFVCEVVAGELVAGDDAAEARWCAPEELPGLELVPELMEALNEWGLLPARGAPAALPRAPRCTPSSAP